MAREQSSQDGRKDNEFGHGGMSKEEQRRAREKGGQHSHSNQHSGENNRNS